MFKSVLADYNALEYRHEILDVDKGVLATIYLERLQGFHDKLAEVLPPLLAVVYAVSQVICTRDTRRGQGVRGGVGEGTWCLTFR